MKSLVASALEDLDDKERQVVTLYYLEELTMKEVGAVLGRWRIAGVADSLGCVGALARPVGGNFCVSRLRKFRAAGHS